MLKPIKIVFSFTGVYVMIKLFDFLLERTRIKEGEKTNRARINNRNNGTSKKETEEKVIKKDKTKK